jgi:hypothetical protein
MPTSLKSQLDDVVGGLVNAEPATQITRGIAKVGEAAEPYLNKASDAYDSAKTWVQKKLTPTPPPITTDINLPVSGKRKVTKPVPTRSLSKR